MIYVMADIHGKFDKFMAMLEKIHFSDNDTLYIVGDLVDRGEKPMDVVWYVRDHANIIPIMGNHDDMAWTLLTWVQQQVETGSPEYEAYLDDEIIFWENRNGGTVTVKQFRRLSTREKHEFLDYLDTLPLYKELDVGGKHYILVHAGLPDYVPGKPLSSYEKFDLVWTRPDFDTDLGDENLRVVIGHTPTPTFVDGPARIYRGKNYINIDCGAFFSGTLACLCLDTDEEFYV